MFLFGGILNLIAAAVFAWWSFSTINHILLLIPAVLFPLVGSLCIAKADKE